MDRQHEIAGKVQSTTTFKVLYTLVAWLTRTIDATTVVDDEDTTFPAMLILLLSLPVVLVVVGM